MQRNRRGFRVLATVLVTAFVTALLVGTTSPADAAPVRYTGGTYAAMGDSRAAGSFYTPTPAYFQGCKRSALAYPAYVAAVNLARRYIDTSCTGAQSTHLHKTRQATDGGPKPVQLHRVPRDAQLITVSIGGNDMRWNDILRQCNTPAFTDRRCRHNRELAKLAQERIALMESRVTPALRAIREKAPRAQIIVVGLGGFIGTRGCWPMVPVSDPDARWMREVFHRANGALWRATAKAGGTFIDANRRSAGHDPCNVVNSWYESAVPRPGTLPYHVNPAGSIAIASMINGAIRR